MNLEDAIVELSEELSALRSRRYDLNHEIYALEEELESLIKRRDIDEELE